MGTIELDRLPLFVAVAETGSFSAAAERLSVPKSTVSRGVAALEEAMGVRLVHRTTRRVSLSTAGAALYERVGPALGALEKALGDLPELEEQPSGELRITVPMDVGAAIIAELVSRFVARYPAVQVDVRVTNRVVDLVGEGFDAAVRVLSGRPRDSTLSARKLGSAVLGVYAAPSYLARRGTPRVPADLEGHEWVVFRPASTFRLQGPGESATVVAHGRVVCDDMMFACQAACAGAGLGLLPTILAAPEVSAGRLVPILCRWDAHEGSLWLVLPGAKHLPRKVAAFRDFAIEFLKERPAVQLR